MLVQLHAAEDAVRLRQHPGLQAKGLHIASTASNPRVIVYYIPADLTHEELLDAIWQQNTRLASDLTRDQFLAGIIHGHIQENAKAQTHNLIIEATAAVRNSIRRAQGVYIGWKRCRVLDYVRAVRCYKCLDLGHVTKHCRAENSTCTHCGGTHEAKECTKQAEDPLCAPCIRRKKPGLHSYNCDDCPVYKAALERVLIATDYGGRPKPNHGHTT